MRMFQRSPLTVLNFCLIFIDIEAKVTKVNLNSGVQKHPIYLPPLSVYAIDDVVLGRCRPQQVQNANMAATSAPPGPALETDGCGALPPLPLKGC